jgi:hypothetical protein
MACARCIRERARIAAKVKRAKAAAMKIARRRPLAGYRKPR